MTLAFLRLLHGCRAAGFVAGVSLLTACPPKEGETGTDGDSSGTGDATAGVSTTSGGATTGDVPTTSDGTADGTTGGTGGGMTTVATTTTEGTTTVGTGGEVPPELMEACTAACDKFFECIVPAPFPDKATCIQGCADEGVGEPMCVAASVAFDNCIAGLDCPEFKMAVETEDFGTCNDEFEAVEGACQSCESFAGVGEGACSLGKICPDMPVQEISCMDATCTCLVDDVAQGECPANGVCALDIAELQMLAAECCGFDL